MKQEYGKLKGWENKVTTLTDKQRQTRSTKTKMERYTYFSKIQRWQGSSEELFQKNKLMCVVMLCPLFENV